MRSIWAVAKNTIKQALRMKVAVVFVLLLIVMLGVLGTSTTGDETLKGRLQTFVSYGLSLTSFLLCLLTIIISIYTVTSDIEQKQIFTVITKPIRRHEFLLGKLLGVLVLDVILLCIFAGIIYTITVNLPRYRSVSESDLAEANTQFFTARAALTIPEEDVTKEVLERYESLKSRDELPENTSYEDIIAELTRRAQISKRAAAVGGTLLWEFKNIEPLSESLFIRFKYEVWPNPPDAQVYGRWYVGEYQHLRYGTESQTPVYDQVHVHSVGTFHEIEVPANVIPENGHMALAFMNGSRDNTIVIFPPDGLEVLYKADTFTANFIRAAIMILFRLVFLATLGVLASTFLSFPVAILFCLVIFLTASFSGFVTESFDYISANATAIYSYTLKWMIKLLPQFDDFNPTKFLVPARLLSWSLLGKCALFVVCIKAFLMLVLGLVIFSFREIARITV